MSESVSPHQASLCGCVWATFHVKWLTTNITHCQTPKRLLSSWHRFFLSGISLPVRNKHCIVYTLLYRDHSFLYPKPTFQECNSFQLITVTKLKILFITQQLNKLLDIFWCFSVTVSTLSFTSINRLSIARMQSTVAEISWRWNI